jgi:hypothetical protein
MEPGQISRLKARIHWHLRARDAVIGVLHFIFHTQITTHLGGRVSTLRPCWNDAVQDFDAGFHKARDLVRPELVDRIKFYAKVWWPARGIVTEALENRFKVKCSNN